MKKRLFSLLLVLCMVASMFTFGVQPAAVADSNPHDQIQGSNILHCFNWSYNEIRANLQAIKDAGYTAIQTSPVQPAKDYNKSWNDKEGQWWKLYQPLDIRIANGNETWLGSKEELTALCTEADALGLYVIVDIVANHVANVDSGGYTLSGTYNVSPQVADRLQDPDGSQNLYHTSETPAGDTNRTTMTQNHISMPDLNTGNQAVQQMVLDLLKECVDCGVDGFRFDAAKHIELPTDSGCASNFWPYVINGIQSYAGGADKLYIYGEALFTIGTATENYTTYMAITDNVTGNAACKAVKDADAGALAVGTYDRGNAPQDYVLWAESHDTYEDDSTSGISSDKIIRTWAIVGARAYSTALFLARPNERMGLASTDTSWKSPVVAAVNKFKDYYDGTGEYFSYDANSNKVTMLERGTAGSGAGAVIVKLDGAGWVTDLPVNLMSNGTYADEVTGNVFSVSGGKITGEIGPTGVAVVYKTTTAAVPTPPVTSTNKLYLKPGTNWKSDGARFAMYVFNGSNNAWTSMTDTDGDGIYEATIPSGNWPNVIFCRMNGSTTENNWTNKWNQTGDLTIPTDGKNLFTVADDAWDGSTTTWSTYGSGNTGGGTTVTADEGYYIVGTMTGWAISPEFKLTKNTAVTSTDEYMVDIPLIRTTAPAYNSKFKVVYSPDGVTMQTWFPDGMDNDFGHTASDVPLSGVYTVYFRPNYNGDSSWYNNCINAVRTKYYVTVNDADKNGTVTVDKASAAAGETVTVTVTPNAGYELETLVYKCETALGSGQFNTTTIAGTTFTMPSENAVVVATFAENGEPTPTPTAEPTATPTTSTDPTPTPTPTPTPAAAGYYLIGNMTNWAVDSAYRLTQNTAATGTEYSIENVALTTSSQFKVVYSADGTSKTTWYPDGMGNNYGENGEITSAGTYTIYFRPDGDGDDDWFNHVIYAALTSASTDPTPVPGNGGYYLVGNMNSWTLDSTYKLTQNTAATGTEYSIENVALTTSSQFKVVYSADGTNTTIWYPDGTGNAYGENGEITAAGNYTIYFRPNADGGGDWFNNVIYVVKQANTVADGVYLVDNSIASPTLADIDSALKLELFGTNGQIFNSSNTYVRTGNFGVHTYRVVKVENDTVIEMSNSAQALIQTTGVTETVYAEVTGRYFNDWGSGVSQLTGYFLNVSANPVPKITADCLFTETATSGVYSMDYEFTSGMGISVVALQDGMVTAKYPNKAPGDGDQKDLEQPLYMNNYTPTRVFFRPDGQGSTANGWFEGYFIDVQMAPVCVSHSLTLGSEIGVNFLIQIPNLDNVGFSDIVDLDFSDSKMQFAISGRGAADLKATEIKYSDLPDKLKTLTNDGYTYKACFTCKINVLQMADWIKPTFCYGENTIPMDWYAARSYCEAWHYSRMEIQDNTNGYYTGQAFSNTDVLIQALANWGYHTQLFLASVNNFEIGDGDNQYAAMDLSTYNRNGYDWMPIVRYYTKTYTANDYTTIDTAAKAAYPMVITGDTTVFGSPTMSLVLDSETAIRIYFKPIDGVTFGTFNVTVRDKNGTELTRGTDYTVTSTGNRYLVQINGIKASQLGDKYTIEATSDSVKQTVEVRALSYVWRVIESATFADNAIAKNAVCALYEYAVAAANY